jgi:acyl carrier protein
VEFKLLILQLSQTAVDCKYLDQEKVLVAYYVKQDVNAEYPDRQEIRSFLQKKLPEYMIPGFYVELDHIPFTSNGKLDRKALPLLSGEDTVRREYIAPRNAVETKLVQIWQDVLGIDKLGITDNFFEIGGNSLIIVKLSNKISSEFDVTLTMGQFFVNPTIEKLAEQLIESSNVLESNEDDFEEYDSIVI